MLSRISRAGGSCRIVASHLSRAAAGPTTDMISMKITLLGIIQPRSMLLGYFSSEAAGVGTGNIKVPSSHSPVSTQGMSSEQAEVSTAAVESGEQLSQSSEAVIDKPANNGEHSSNSDAGNQSDQCDDKKSTKAARGGPSWWSLLFLMVTGGGVLLYYDKEKKRHIEDMKSRSSTVKEGPSVGTAAIGGPFKLVNHDGKTVTERSFLGNWSVIYFGFTHCPDICPDELQKLAAAVDKIKEKAKIDVVPVFITVDPERDTVEQVHDYIKEFHPDLIGLTGTPEEIRNVARAYRVYYMKTEEEGSDYLVDHSIVMYLMNPKMEFVKFFGKNYDADSLADGIIKEIREHK